MNANLGACLYVIRACEGTTTAEGYTALFGWRPGNGKVFTSFADHPRIYFDYTDLSGRTIKTSAAGAFQATATTWDDFIRERGPHDFSPASQDEFAVWLITKCGALEDCMAGRLRAFIDKCGGRWASLPSATVPQPRRTYEFCVAAFLAAGGKLEGTQLAAPIEERTITPTQASLGTTLEPTQQPGGRMGAIALPLLAQLIPQVLGLFSGRAQATIAEKTGADPKVAADFMQAMIAQVGHAVGVPVVDDKSATQAVAALTAAPDATAKAAALEKQALATLDALLKAGDKVADWDAAKWQAELSGRKASSEIAVQEYKAGLWDMTPTLVRVGAGLIAVLVVALLSAVIFQSVTGSGTIDSGLLGLAGPILMAGVGAWNAMIAYRFDGSKESSEQSKAIISKMKEA